MSGQNFKMNGTKKASASESVKAKRKPWVEYKPTAALFDQSKGSPPSPEDRVVKNKKGPIGKTHPLMRKPDNPHYIVRTK